MESGVLCRRWNGKTAACVLLYCLPMFVLQLTVIVIGPRLRKDKSRLERLPHYFTVTATRGLQNATSDTALCTYPLLNIILLGVFASALTVYLFWIGRRILKLVINKGLKRRVYTLIFSVSSFLPLRVLLLGLSVLSKPEHFLFEALAFSAFLALSCCAGVCICMLVYYPVADSLALGDPRDMEARRRYAADEHETISLVANHSHLEESGQISPWQKLRRIDEARINFFQDLPKRWHFFRAICGAEPFFTESRCYSTRFTAASRLAYAPACGPENRARNRVLIVNINFVKKEKTDCKGLVSARIFIIGLLSSFRLSWFLGQ
ncbi:PLASMINOGEN ACTIVATOR INHIBITOR [Salix koriyanagi]|uniref:PLASMINOGEN ACTIVATOR INHIBITOR n=1 Tax=Salix koriyanagi TaxID=2511006 RepID=A0A9Q0T413_9ROSI|nr:PLASMINOGEN ACTIVATOR INHIBITOR [Salix koriyanagi]